MFNYLIERICSDRLPILASAIDAISAKIKQRLDDKFGLILAISH
jgi:hypothetical protein